MVKKTASAAPTRTTGVSEMMTSHLIWRSLLLCPGNRTDMVAKLGRAGADCVVIDLEDGVPVDEKVDARRSVRQAASALADVAPRLPVFVRINGTNTPWWGGDVEDALGPWVAGVVVPKVEAATQMTAVAASLDRAGLEDAVMIAGWESATGIEEAPRLGHPRLVAAYFGAEDYVADVGGRRTVMGAEVSYARSRAVMAARIVGVPILDQVVVEVENEARFVAEATEADQLGYSGKLCLHPSQVPLANRAFTPSTSQVERSRRLLAAATDAGRTGDGVVLFEGQMVDLPMVRQAERTLARARNTGNGEVEQ